MSKQITKKQEKQENYSDIFKKSMDRAFRGGLSGGIAMAINICTLMPLRTAVNYQYRYGTNSLQSIRTLYSDGGILRFYRGFGFAIIQGPWSRFGDTFANSGTLALLNSMESTQELNVGTKTLLASSAASLFRVISTPLDTCKTTLQVEGKSGLKRLQLSFEMLVVFHGAFQYCGMVQWVQQVQHLSVITHGFSHIIIYRIEYQSRKLY